MISIHAHFDGQQIVLDEPITSLAGQRLLVTVLDELDDRANFYRLAKIGLARCDGENETEYTLLDGR